MKRTWIAAAAKSWLHQARRTSRIGSGLQVGPEPLNTVPKEGLEPSHPKAQEPKSCVSTSSTTPALFDCSARSARIAPLERAYFVVARGEKHVPSLRVYCSLRSLRLALVSRCLPRSLADGKACLLARSSRTASRQPLSTAARVFTSSLRWLLLGGRSAATATGTATSESVNVDEIDAYVLIAGQRPDYGTQSSCGAT